MNIFKKLWKKKGVSPLIATVLLIAFAVSLGAVVMNWGRGYVESTAEQAEAQSAEKISCSMDTSIDIVQVGTKMKLCVDNTVVAEPELKFTLINTGSIDIQGIQVTELYTDAADKIPLERGATISSPVPVGKSKLMQGNLTLNVTTDFDDIEQLELAPIILVKGVEVICLEHAIKRLPAEIGECS